MLALHPRLVAADAEEGRAWYCVMVACVSLLLFVALAAAVGIARAVAIAGAVVLILGLAGAVVLLLGLASCLAHTGTTTRRAAVRLVHVHQRCACGLSDAAIRALPTFAYQPPPAAATKGTADGEGSPVPCAVCLEDVQAGEMVRQLLPACSHLFHADCVDAWLRAHRTCPLCRRELPTPNNVAAKPSDDLLPPV